MRRVPVTEAIVIPTGRNGFCCIIPCALLCALYGLAVIAMSLVVWRALCGYLGNVQDAGCHGQRPALRLTASFAVRRPAVRRYHPLYPPRYRPPAQVRR